MFCYPVSRKPILVRKPDLFTKAKERRTAAIIRLTTRRLLKPSKRTPKYKRIGAKWSLRKSLLGTISNRISLTIYWTIKGRNHLTSKGKTGPHYIIGQSRKASNLKFSSQKAEDQIKYTSQKIKEQEISRMNEEIQ